MTAEADRVFCQLGLFLNVFFHWMYFKMKDSCYQEPSFIHGWLVLLGFWLRNVPLGNPISDGIVFVFHFA